jgi:FkbM family methyltransferase
VDLYEQDAELRLLGALVSKLDQRVLIDVGAERGGVAQELLRAGAQQVHAIEPHPENAQELHDRFAGDRRVRVHEYALGDRDGVAELHVSTDPQGGIVPFGHTLLERDDTDQIAWRGTVEVTCRSLASLVCSEELPRRVGILKIDTEGNDLAVVRGMGTMEADVVVVEHWSELPHGLGACPWTTRGLLAELEPRGFSHFAFIVHRGEFVTLKWDDGEVERGAMGNLVFLHERVLPRLLPDVLELAGALAEQAVRVGQGFASAASERLALLNELQHVAEERQQALEEATARMNELEHAAEERLQKLEATTAQMNAQAAELESLRSR